MRERRKRLLVMSNWHDEAGWIRGILRQEARAAEVTLVVPDETAERHRALHGRRVRILPYARGKLSLLRAVRTLRRAASGSFTKPCPPRRASLPAGTRRGGFDECYLFLSLRVMFDRRLRLAALASGARRFRIFAPLERTPTVCGRPVFALRALSAEVRRVVRGVLVAGQLSIVEPLAWRYLSGLAARRGAYSPCADRVHFFLGSLRTGGAERQVVRLAGELTRRGYRCKVWLLYPPEGRSSAQQSGRSGPEGPSKPASAKAAGGLSAAAVGGAAFKRRSGDDTYFAEQLVAAGGEWQGIWSHPAVRRWGRLGETWWRFLRERSLAIPAAILAAILRHEKPAVLQTMLDVTNVAGVLAGRLAGVPVVVGGLRNVHPVEYLDDPNRWREFYRVVDGRMFDAMISNSHAGAESYLRHERGLLQENIRVVHNGIDDSAVTVRDGERERELRLELGVPPEAAVVACIASLRPRKRQDVLLRACAELTAMGTEFATLIVGEGEERDALGALARKLDVASRVVFTGGRSDVPDIIRTARVVVLSSRVSEGFPNALLEAQFLGRPVVSTRVGDVGELVEDGVTGFLVDVGDHKAMALAIARLIADDDLWERMGRAAAAHARERFSTERMVEATLSIYRELAEAKGLRLGSGVQQG